MEPKKEEKPQLVKDINNLVSRLLGNKYRIQNKATGKTTLQMELVLPWIFSILSLNLNTTTVFYIYKYVK